jgi:hypothetical protein
MNYFKLQISDGSTKENFVDEVLADHRITTHIDFAKEFIELVKPHDIVLVHKGNQPHSLVEVLYKIENKKEINGTSFGHDYKVRIISLYADVKDRRDIFPENFKIGPNGTFTHLKNNSNTLVIIKKWLEKVKDFNFTLADFKKFQSVYSKKVRDRTKFQKFINYSHTIITETEIEKGNVRFAIPSSNEFMITIGMRAVLNYVAKREYALIGLIMAKSEAELLRGETKTKNIHQFEGGLEMAFVSIADFNFKSSIVSQNKEAIALEYNAVKNSKLVERHKDAQTTNKAFEYIVYNNLNVEEFIKEFNNNRALTDKKNILNSISMNQPLNQILYGPPGTGKTYHTINKAISIANPAFDLKVERHLIKAEYEKLVEEGKIVFFNFSSEYGI